MPEFTIGNYLATRLEQIGSWKANGESGSWVITGRRAPGAAVTCASRSRSPRSRMTAAGFAKRGKPGSEEGSTRVGSRP